MSTTLEHIKYT